ncbi:UNVERIFIED_CONTAM: Nuclear transport factor 2, partial [Sesamum calycinum]
FLVGMATQTANLPPAPSAQVVGNAFVEQYYHILHHSPELVFRFYQDTSVLSRPDADGLMTTVTTMKIRVEKSEGYTSPWLAGFADSKEEKLQGTAPFAGQFSFQIGGRVKSINDKICSLDYKNYKAEIKTADAQDSYKDGVIVLVTGCLTGKDNLRKKFTQTFFLAPQDKGYYVLNDVFSFLLKHFTSSCCFQSLLKWLIPPMQMMQLPQQEVETNEKKTGDQVIDERQASSDRDILVEAESHLNENHESAVAESDPSASQEDVPKKSYASIPVNPATEASDSEAAAPVPPDNAQESEDAEDEVEGHSIYIRNLPLNATVSQLEAEFKKFGTIKPNGVQVRSNKASPITIGDRQAAAEIKRTTTRVGSGRGRFTSSRGGFHNDNFRGRGNFGSGRTYVRNDNFRGRGNFSGGHGGEGYQQGRGRGGEGYQKEEGRSSLRAKSDLCFSIENGRETYGRRRVIFYKSFALHMCEHLKHRKLVLVSVSGKN